MALALGACRGTEEKAVASPRFHAISGEVTAIDGPVIVSLSGPLARSTTTGASGRYRFSDLPDGIYIVTPSRSGRTFMPASLSVPLRGEDESGVSFAAVPLPVPIPDPPPDPVPPPDPAPPPDPVPPETSIATIPGAANVVTLSCAGGTGSCAVHYEVDGIPSLLSPVALVPICLASAATLRFFAVDSLGIREATRSLTIPEPGDRTVAARVCLLHEDMVLPHEALPHGTPDTPTFGWAKAPRYNTDFHSEPFNRATGWGLAYYARDAAADAGANVLVEVTRMQALWLSKSGAWNVLQATPAQLAFGQYYLEDDLSDAGHLAAATFSRTPGGGFVVRMLQTSAGRAFHFWFEHLASIEVNQIEGFIMAFEARLTPADPAAPADLDAADLLANASGDRYWVAGDGVVLGVADWGIGRFKRLGRSVRTFTGTSLPLQMLNQHPPPALLP